MKKVFVLVIEWLYFIGCESFLINLKIINLNYKNLIWKELFEVKIV